MLLAQSNSKSESGRRGPESLKIPESGQTGAQKQTGSPVPDAWEHLKVCHHAHEAQRAAQHARQGGLASLPEDPHEDWDQHRGSQD